MNKVAMKFFGTTTVIAPIVLIILTIWMAFAFSSPARAGERPIYGPDGKYQGSVFDYGRTQTYSHGVATERRVRLEDAADDSAIREHVEIILTPLTGFAQET
jgi:hypothetical protein